jgi:hypothetical protein
MARDTSVATTTRKATDDSNFWRLQCLIRKAAWYGARRDVAQSAAQPRCRRVFLPARRSARRRILDRIDEIAPPGIDVAPLEGAAYVPPAISELALRRRPAAERAAA